MWGDLWSGIKDFFTGGDDEAQAARPRSTSSTSSTDSTSSSSSSGKTWSASPWAKAQVQDYSSRGSTSSTPSVGGSYTPRDSAAGASGASALSRWQSGDTPAQITARRQRAAVADERYPNFTAVQRDGGDSVVDRTAAVQANLYSSLQNPRRTEDDEIKRRAGDLIEPGESRVERIDREAAEAAGPNSWEAKFQREQAKGKARREAAANPEFEAKRNELSREEFMDLSPRQQAAVRFNTGLLDARAEDEDSGDTTATRNFLTELDLVGPDGSLDEYLNLDRAISQNLLETLDDETTRKDTASTLRYARGDEDAAGEARQFSNARADSGASARVLMDNLTRGSGRRGLRSEQKTARGYGGDPADAVVQGIYQTMIDPQYEMTWDDVVNGIATQNGLAGTDVTEADVANFTRDQLRTADFGSIIGNGDGPLNNMDPNLSEPLASAEIRQRYGL